MKYLVLTVLVLMMSCSTTQQKEESQELPEKGFPFYMPKEKPAIKLSKAMERNYDAYMGIQPKYNELYSQFKYTELKGFDYNNHDGTITRRDPSKIIFENGKYYIWYTYRNTKTAPVGGKNAHLATDEIPSSDWDLCDIWYATSKDGFTWEEQGVAIKRPEKPAVGWRSVTTTDILKWKGKYYLYYQGFMEVSGLRGDDCPVAVSYADSPDGPWTPHSEVVIPNGGEGQWDQFSIHDPYPLVHNGKIYLYYKSDSGKGDDLIRLQGLATADNPLGPFTKHPQNPIINSGHETTMFPFKEGIAALVIKDGNEHFTVQYAEDGVNFDIASITELMPVAGGPFIPDAFTDTKDGRGITWGVSHLTNVTEWSKNHAILLRFDCDLSLDVDDQQMKKSQYYRKPAFYYKHGLSKAQKDRVEKQNKELLKNKN
ncbi:glycoside hydrolase [Polaribacter reichenbachii]|nr:family 43 glycosylhydrolase [Polaribacter reichenbachii]APZ45558.1 glycoside hydrolase [Polaribacter reichenbachii]AUC19420.1 glycoside hydrolase [Polaribacter reichenbachii]